MPDHQEAPIFEPDWSIDDEQFEADLAELAQLHRELEPGAIGSAPTEASQSFVRLDVAPEGARPTAAAMPSWEPRGEGGGLGGSTGFRPMAAWLLILSGTSTLFCGAMLVGWSFYTAATLFWKIGLPIAMGGQAILLMGVVLSLDVAAQCRQQQAKAIYQLHLQQLQQAAPGDSQSHPVVPSPHQLLTELNKRLRT